MKQVLLQIGKHSSIYLLAQVVINSLSVLMLPVYLHYFSPSEFGAMTLVDLVTVMLTALLATGILSALIRHHFEAAAPEEERTVWWTGYLFIVGSISVACVAGLVFAEPLARLLFQAEIPRGPLWLRLAAISFWFEVQILVVNGYLRSRKQSASVMRQSIGRSLVFVACALPGITLWELGPTAMYIANVAASSSLMCVNYRIIAREWGRPRISWPVFRELWSYGWPLFLIGVLITLMHQANRWFLDGLVEVGLLSLGLSAVDKVNRLIVMPFEQIWSTLVYELHKEHPEQAVRTFCFVFEVFCYVLISVFLACCLAAGPALMIVARPEYLASVPLIPILCLAQFFFAMNMQFQAPMRLSKLTYLMLPSAVTGTLVAVLANWWLIPLYGVFGAAWATLVTYFAYTAVNLIVARQIDVHPYPFHRIGAVLLGVFATFAAYRLLEARLNLMWPLLGIGIGLWVIWTGVMAAIAYRQYDLATATSADAVPAEPFVTPERVEF